MTSRAKPSARWIPLTAVILITIVGCVLVVVTDWWWWWFIIIGALALSLIGIRNRFQKKHSILRNYPLMGYFRFGFERIRPELQQYFIETNTDGTPFDRETRSLVYQRAKLVHQDLPFGTQLDTKQVGYEWINHSLAPQTPADDPPTVTIGGPDCTQPYDMALLNVSAMSFGALSSNAIRALNKGAAMGGFAHDTGEGGLSKYHQEFGGDLVWEIGTAYFGTRTKDGGFDEGIFREKAAQDQVKCVSIKLSQGAKPGLGGVMPAPKVTEEIAEVRGVPVGVTCISPPAHSTFSTPVGLIEWVAELRELSGGKPVGFKLCIGDKREFLAICKAMLEVGTTPDFIIIDGGEGGTGAAPLEFENHVGTPLTEGLIFAHNALVGSALRDKIRLGASGKVASGFNIVSRIAQGADYTNSARAMMFAVGCIQSLRCHTNQCPVGVATQDPRRTQALIPETKAERVKNFQIETVKEASRIIASVGLEGPHQLEPRMLHRRVAHDEVMNYSELFGYLETGELLEGPRESWRQNWASANPARFAQ
jgi:glutamate synthase domain-containing protein 2